MTEAIEEVRSIRSKFFSGEAVIVKYLTVVFALERKMV